jgi:hypothetical protein
MMARNDIKPLLGIAPDTPAHKLVTEWSGLFWLLKYKTYDL